MDRIRPFFTFQGRANRRRYWATFLGLYLAVFIGVGVASLPVVGLPIFGLLGLAATVAALMLGVRRLHDRGKAGWWLIPMYGPLAFFSVLAAGAEGAGEAEGADSEFRNVEESFVVEDVSDDHQNLVLVFAVLDVLGQFGDGDGVSDGVGLGKPFENDLVELGVGSTGEELVEFDQQSVV